MKSVAIQDIIILYFASITFAAMVELVDTLGLGTSALGRGGTTPSRGTEQYYFLSFIEHIQLFLLITSQ